MPHNFLQYGVVAFVTFAIISGRAAGRELRPSEHGLAYQVNAASPTQNGDAQKMRSFFGSATSAVPLPEARGIGDDTWRSAPGDGGSRDSRRDHVRVGLLVAAAVCGTAGVVLLVVSGIVFAGRRRRQEAEAERLASNSGVHAVK